MGDSSDSEEFYDAEEFTPIKGSKRSSLCKNINVTDGGSPILKEKVPVVKPEELPQPTTHSTPAVEANIEDDRTSVKNVVQGRKRFQELRRCMQTEEEDDGVPDTALPSDHTYTLEHPFKIISHDTMSLQSMTSLGRIGRILSGAAETHSNFRDLVAPSASSREPSTISDDPLASDNRSQNALATSEPDVIASTKANSLKHARAPAVVSVSGAPAPPAPPAHPAQPVAPPRRKRRDKVPGSQSQCGEGEDTRSVSTAGDDPIYPRRPDKPQLDDLLVQPPLSHSLNQTMALPSPASTIESLTREFQDSLELSQSKYGNDVSGGVSARECRSSRSSERASGSSRSSTAQRPPHLLHSVLDINEAVRGECVVRAQDEERARSNSRTHSEGRAHAHAHLTAHQQHAQPADIQQTSASLGHARKSVGGRTRRRSAGDSPTVAPALRTRSSSGHQLSDIEILEQVTVLNLDTAGERMPLSVAEHKLPQCINPLSLHIMRLTSEYISSARPQDDDNTRETDEESESVCVGGVEDETKEIKRESTDRQTTAIRRKTEKVLMNDLVKCHSHDNINRRLTGAANSRLKRFFGSTVKRTVDAAKSLAQEVSHARHKEDVADIADDVRGEHNIKLKASNSHKGPYDFDGCVRHVQEMGSGHTGAVWCCKMSVCGRLLATAGQDRLLRVWVTRDAHHMFQDMRTKYNAEKKSSPTPSQESLSLSAPPPSPEAPLGPSAPFCPKPFCVYSGHTSDLLDVSWSKNYFLLSSSMDKTVRLWHISRGECLCCFQHIDFVTAIVFHPRDDRYFLSGSLDGKLRLWNIPDKKVAVWNEVDGKTKLITAANFCQNGKFAVVGTYDGRCIFYTTDQLKYHTQIDVRSTRGKNSTGRKISGIEPMPNDDKILVTSNDSRIRLYDLRDLNLSCKYKGYVNVSSQIKASFSHDGKYIVSGSENQCIYIWKTYHDYSKFSSVRRDRNDFWEGIKAHNAVVTCAVFAPNPDHMIRMIAEREAEANMADKTPEEREEAKAAEGGMVSSSQTGHVLVSADFNGCIKVFVHKAKPKHSSLPASALA
ncbi:WD repeat-containing protein 44 isoform X1 [Papilio machaon]|uniref:WD repeat-containing protein 44 isoform X1 n=2 Tax=Papilio machaon TaxID=76193 RepID=UPI001E665161|nr:WD repeat-containing protein 44 isoform X1 [Papilio machaon]